jgi:hypothetical protein
MRATTKREDIATKRGALTRAQDEVARARREVNEAETRLRTQQAEADKIAGEIEALRDQAMLGILTPAVVDALAPEHSLKGCSDEDAPNHEGRCARIGDTRIICNPFGYLHHEENPKFQRDLVVDMPAWAKGLDG